MILPWLLALILPLVTGAYNPVVKQATLTTTVCKPGYSTAIRPPASYTRRIKIKQLQQWHYPDQEPSHYQADHFISLSLGGAPRSEKNLWPEPWAQARRTDRMEWKWHRDLCTGKLKLKQAQRLEIAWKRTHG